jgi:hypothetical protein
VRNPASTVASPAAPERIQNETSRTSPLAMAASTGAEIWTSPVRCGFLATSMRNALLNGWPVTAAVDIFAYSPALALSLNAEAESAGRSAVAPGSAAYAAQTSASPALNRMVRTRLMIVVLLVAAKPYCNRLLRNRQETPSSLASAL